MPKSAKCLGLDLKQPNNAATGVSTVRRNRWQKITNYAGLEPLWEQL
jgi:hypothetical protein